MSLDNYLRIASENGLDGFTIWKVKDGWQANSRFGASNGFSVVVGGDIVQAGKASLTSGRHSMFPDWTGFGLDGPVGIEFKALIEAIGRNWRARRALEEAAPGPTDDEL